MIALCDSCGEPFITTALADRHIEENPDHLLLSNYSVVRTSTPVTTFPDTSVTKNLPRSTRQGITNLIVLAILLLILGWGLYLTVTVAVNLISNIP